MKILQNCFKILLNYFRYVRCRAIGMSPNLVLKGEAKEKFSFPRQKLLQLSRGQVEAKPEINQPQSEKSKGQVTFMLDAICYDFTLATAENPIKPSLIRKVIEGHLRPKDWDESHTLALLQIAEVHKDVIVKFCQRTRLFQSLRQNDQHFLLTNNGDLYIQYILARYLKAACGHDQICWLLGANAPIFGNYLIKLER